MAGRRSASRRPAIRAVARDGATRYPIRMRIIRAILFDLGDTLWHTDLSAPPYRPAAATAQASACLAARGLAVTEPAALVRALFEEGWKAAAAAYAGDLRSPHFPALTVRVALDFGLTLDVAAGAALWESACGGGALPPRSVLPGTREALAALFDTGVALGIVTNRSVGGATLDAELQAYRLRRYFSVVLASCDVGYLKPHPAIFARAAQQLSVAPEQVAMVGDSLRADTGGAQSAGMTAIWLCPPNTNASSVAIAEGTAHQPDFVIQRLSDLQQLPLAFEPKSRRHAGAGSTRL